tara:strand:+ start:10278 stop:12713 length:2436 start_codon:yes stop_codon:yes gene_type:complete
MPYYGRQVARLKGVGKYINWNQGGGPKKAGLGPQINVSTWGRRVISRRTNNCCCDPIELTSIQLSIPGGWRLTDNPWNYIQSGTNENLPSGLVGPPRNDIENNVIHTERQIYSIVTFNKPISQNINLLGNIEECGNDIIGPGNYEFGQPNLGIGRMTFLPSGTGSQQSFNNSAINGLWINPTGLNGDSFLGIIQNLIHFGQQGLLIERTDDGFPNNYMIIRSNTGFVLDSSLGLPVIKAPGGSVNTGPPIWVEGAGNVFGSIPPGPQGLKITSLAHCVNINTNNLSLPLTGLKIANGMNANGNTVKIQPRTTSTANTRYYDLVTVSTPVAQIPGGTKINTFLPTLLNNQSQNYSGYLLTGSRVLVEDAPGLSGLGTTPSTTITKISKPEGRALVDMADGQNNTFEKFQSAPDDTKFMGNNNDPWQQGEGGSIVTEYFGAYSTPLMDVSNNGFAIKSSSLKTPTKDYYNRYIGNGFGIYTNNQRCFDKLSLNSSLPVNDPKRNIALIQGDYANNQNEFYSADAMYISTTPVKWLDYDYALFINITSIMQVSLKNSTSRSGATSLVGPPLQPGQPNTITTNTLQYWNQAEKPPPTLGGPVAQSDAGPWQGWGIKPLPFGTPPVTPPLAMPAWSDLIGSAYGMAISPFVTLDASNVEQYAVGPVTVYFPNSTYNPDIIGATLGDVVEKMRQITFTAFPSYIIKNLLNSKYRCGNDGFDGPIDDITLPSLNPNNRIISSANENEGGILTIGSNSPSNPASVAATSVIPPTVTPPTPPSTPTPPDPITPPSGGGTIGGGGGTTLPIINPIGSITIP